MVYSSTCNKLYQSINTVRRKVVFDDEHSAFSGHATVRSAETPPGLAHCAHCGSAKHHLQRKGAYGASSHLQLRTQSEELQYFVHMLLSKRAEPTFPSSSSKRSDAQNNSTKHLKTEEMGVRMHRNLDLNKSSYQCTHCKRTFAHRKSLWDHQQAKHRSKSLFACPSPTCTYSASRKANLRRHRAIKLH
jgi:transposase